METAAPSVQIPVIDISPFLASPQGTPLTREAQEVVCQWREVFGRLGFVNVTGHGVPHQVIENAYNVAKDFFSLPEDVKQTCDLGKGYGPGGYTKEGVERVSATLSPPDGSQLAGAARARPPDRVENMLVHRRDTDVIPAEVPGYQEAVYAYFDHNAQLLRAIMEITACAVDLHRKYFEKYWDNIEGAYQGAGNTLRLAHYPVQNSPPAVGQLRYGEHTDYTGFTILWQDHNARGQQTAADIDPPLGGLQVRMPDGDFVDCPPVPGAFTVNSGDLIQVWTNDVLLSNTHRVANPPLGHTMSRTSLVFFTGPNPDTVVECLPTCTSPDRPPRYAPIKALDHLMRKLGVSNT